MSKKEIIIEYTPADTFEVDPANNSRVVLRGDSIKVSDGYHTMDELYEHRFRLFIMLAKFVRIDHYSENSSRWNPVWRSKLHSDGSSYDGWFVLGIREKAGEQITYHLPLSYWDECDFAEPFERAPKFDGHTSADVLERLKSL